MVRISVLIKTLFPHTFFDNNTAAIAKKCPVETGQPKIFVYEETKVCNWIIINYDLGHEIAK
jgi:hypothetical protein